MAERLMRSYSSVIVFVGQVVFTLLVSFFFFAFELAVYGRGIGEWLTIRWYVPVGVFVALVLQSVVYARRREQEANAVFDLSEEIDSSLAPLGESVPGQLRVDHHPVDLVSVTATRRGIFLSKRSKVRAFFSWSKLARFRVYRSAKQHLRAEVAIPLGTGSRELLVELPWTRAMSRFIPGELKT